MKHSRIWTVIWKQNSWLIRRVCGHLCGIRLYTCVYLQVGVHPSGSTVSGCRCSALCVVRLSCSCWIGGRPSLPLALSSYFWDTHSTRSLVNSHTQSKTNHKQCDVFLTFRARLWLLHHTASFCTLLLYADRPSTGISSANNLMMDL